MRIAIVTARAAVGTDDDEQLLLAALSEAATVVEVVEWEDPVADWSAFDLAGYGVRSTWDYTLRRDAFLAWATATAAGGHALRASRAALRPSRPGPLLGRKAAAAGARAGRALHVPSLRAGTSRVAVRRGDRGSCRPRRLTRSRCWPQRRPSAIVEIVSANNHDDVVIRRATASDLAAIVALLADDEIGVGRESPDDLTPYQRTFEVIESDQHELLMVAERNGGIIGTLQLSLLPGLSRRGAFRAQIEGVRVAGSERGNALGAYLIEWAINEARSWGCQSVQLTSDKTRVDAHRFYERVGFTATHEGFKLML